MLPLAIALFRIWRELEHHREPRKLAALGLAVGLFGLLVVLGYSLHWAWTGFPGNTLWDWINLLLAPILFALIVVPATIAWMSAEIAEEAEEIADERASAPGPGSPARTR
jgi:predicted PurR-regulated permease PerM